MPSSDDATRKLRSGSRDPLLRLEGQGQIQIVSAELLTVSEPLAALRGLLQADPKLLIFDDAFAGLSDGVRASLFEELRRQQDERGLTCLLLTQDPRLAAPLADEVALLHAGQIVETGATASLLGHPQHPYTQALLTAQPLYKPASVPPASHRAEPLPGCRFRSRCPHAFARCAEEDPVLFVVPGGLSRCFLQDPDASGN